MDNLLTMEHLNTTEIYELIQRASALKMVTRNHVVLMINS